MFSADQSLVKNKILKRDSKFIDDN